ncbi:hypothetical protein FOMG_19639 [Fusarium oxysporum f. sp. melonis 26406]|uniref:Uncharacterized protein n=2 Tax=Fusarium oxysporum TaxID=5507 RepID=A0A2H3FTY2_FUSOX|nr:hypothetical protein FOMG_19639 [Fusarium oxysporum f. sp. melonis 26406]PCD21740.1 hypothetical protein AU210_015543 [Fusarium oxysporum f. sp. radicis-cucumerinum]
MSLPTDNDVRSIGLVSTIGKGVHLSFSVQTALHNTVAHFRKNLIAEEPVEGVEILSPAIFSLDCAPKVVFKIADDSGSKDMVNRWGYVERADAICKKKQLNLLVLPQQSLYEIRYQYGIIHVIAEERLPLANNFLVHARRYETLAKHLDPTLQQLVTFIAASGFRDVDFRNIPILDQDLIPNAALKIALVDLENCGDIIDGTQNWGYYQSAFFGTGGGTRGLFGCIAPQNFPAVKDAALACGIDLETLFPGEYTKSLEKRNRELEAARRCRAGVANVEAFEREVKRIFDTVVMSLFADVSSYRPQLITEPLDGFNTRQRLCKGPLAPRRFRATSTGEADLVLRGVIVLNPDTASTAALGVFIQSRRALSITYKDKLSNDLRELFGEVEDDPTLQYLPDKESFFFHISTASFDDENYLELGRPHVFQRIIDSPHYKSATTQTG